MGGNLLRCYSGASKFMILCLIIVFFSIPITDAFESLEQTRLNPRDDRGFDLNAFDKVFEAALGTEELDEPSGAVKGYKVAKEP